MFEDKKITKEKVKDLLYNLRNEFDNELDYDYESESGRELTNDDFNIMIEFLDRFLRKADMLIDDELEDNCEEFKNAKKEEQQKFIDEQYEKMKKYIYDSSDEELERHYDWYKAEKGDKEDLLNSMFESYCNTYNDTELEEQINKLLEV